MTSENPCALCRSAHTTRFTKTDAKNKQPLPMMVCQACSLVQRVHIPSESELDAYYSHHYRQDYKRTYSPQARHVFRAGRTALDRLAFLNRFAENLTGRHLTDIGAGGGEFVYMASRTGFDARGIEPNEGYSSFSRSAYGVRVDTATLDSLEANCASIITLFHVLEHLPKPEKAIEQIYHALQPDGLLFIEVPNILQKDASPHNIYFAAHLFYFNIAVLKTLASPWFELLGHEDTGNLKAVFRRKKHPSFIQWPDAGAVDECLRRFRSKGWMQYLLAGGGALKPLRRIHRFLAEARVRNQPARTILDTLLAQHTRSGLAAPKGKMRQYLPWLAGTAVCALGVEVIC